MPETGDKEKYQEVADSMKDKVEEASIPETVNSKHLLAGLLIFSVAAVGYSLNDFQLTSQSIEGDVHEVSFENNRADPSRPTISEEDGVKFVNNEEENLMVQFDREVETFEIDSGEEMTVNVSNIVYYEARPVDEEAEFRAISGGVNVQ